MTRNNLILNLIGGTLFFSSSCFGYSAIPDYSGKLNLENVNRLYGKSAIVFAKGKESDEALTRVKEEKEKCKKRLEVLTDISAAIMNSDLSARKTCRHIDSPKI
jgi:hypothetical protein